MNLPTWKKIFYLNTLMLFFCCFVFKEVFLAFLFLNFLGCATWSVEPTPLALEAWSLDHLGSPVPNALKKKVFKIEK